MIGWKRENKTINWLNLIINIPALYSSPCFTNTKSSRKEKKRKKKGNRRFCATFKLSTTNHMVVTFFLQMFNADIIISIVIIANIASSASVKCSVFFTRNATKAIQEAFFPPNSKDDGDNKLK